MHSNDAITPVDATVVRIKDRGEVKEVDYNGAMTAHFSSLWWGKPPWAIARCRPRAKPCPRTGSGVETIPLSSAHIPVPASRMPSTM